MTLITIHNVAFMNRLLEAIRLAIAEGRLKEEKAKWVEDAPWSSQDIAA
jgi:tRNA-guanine family transglycosylase